jgi:hypothetical protein
VTGTATSGQVAYWNGTSSITGENQLNVSRGGTGLNASAAANGTLLIGNTTGFALATLTQGTGMTITNGAGTITLATTLGTDIASSEIVDDTINEADLNLTTHGGAPQNGYILSFDNATGGFTWIANTGGSGSSKWTDAGTVTSLTSTTDDVAIGGTTATNSRFFFDVTTGNQLIFEGTGADDAFETTLVITNPSADRTLTIPNITGTLATLDGGQTFTNATWNGGVISSSYLDTAVILSTEMDTSAEVAAIVGDETGSGALVFGTSPVLTTPNIGAATATSVNGLTLTATTGTLTLANGSTLITSGANSITFTSTGTTTLTLPTTGTLCTTASCLTAEADTLATVTGRGATTATASSFTGGATIRGLIVDNATATYDRVLITAAALGGARFDGTLTNADLTAARTYTLPDVSGTLATLNGSQTFTAATWNGSVIGVQYGGTGIGTLASNGVLYGNGTGAIQATTAGTSAQLLVANGTGVPTFVTLSSDATITNAGVLTIAANAVALGTDTTNDYVASITAGNGMATTGASSGETIAHTLSLGALTADWNQTGAFDISLNNAASELKILGSAGTYYGIFDVGAITASDKTYTFPDASGTVALGTGTANYNAYWTGTNTLGSEQYVSMTRGGTGTTLTASNGGIVYSNASTMAILSGTATGGLALVSGVSGAPSWYAPTIGSVLFAGTGGALTSDTTNFFWDNTNKYLGIGDSTPTNQFDLLSSSAIHNGIIITNTNAGNYNPIIQFELTENTPLFTLGIDDSDSDKFKIATGSDITGTNQFTIDSTGTTYISNLSLGAQSFEADAGAVTWVDMPVTSTPTAGTVERYTAQLDGNPLLTIYGEADGTGGTQNTGVSIGNATLQSGAKFAVTQASTATTAGTLYGAYYSTADTGIVTTGTDTTYGVYNVVTRTGATGGTINNYGSYISLTADNAGAGTSTNYGLYATVTGADTNYAGVFMGGNVGIGTATPTSLFSVGASSQFQVNSSGAIAAAAGVTSSGTITFSGLTAGGVVQAAAGTGTLSVGTLGASSITADSLDFTEFQDQLDLDASTDILADGAEVFSLTNTGTGLSFRVNDAAADTTPFVIDASGNVGIGTTAPVAVLDVGSPLGGAGGGIRLLMLAENPTASSSYIPIDFSVPTSGLIGQFLATSNAYSNVSFNQPANSIGLWTEVSAGSLVLGAGGASGDMRFNTGGYAVSNERIRITSGGNVGIGDTTPASLFTVGNGDLLQVDSNGNLIRINNVAYSWPASQGAASTLLSNNGSGTLSWVSSIGAGAITPDSLDFTEFKDSMLLDASTDIAASGTNVLSITNTGTGVSFLVNDQATDTTPFVIDASGNVGIGYATPAARFDIAGINTEAVLGSEMITSATNRAFTGSAGNWTLGSNWAYGTNNAVHTAGTTGELYLANTYLSAAPVAGHSYQITFTVNTTTVGSLNPNFGDSYPSAIGGTIGTVTQTQMFTAFDTNRVAFSPDTAWAGTIDDVSIKEITLSSPTQIVRNADNTIGLEIRSGGTGEYGTFLGVNAGRANTASGTGNSFVGYSSGSANTTGSNNAFMGTYSGQYNTTGYENTFIGFGAGEYNTVGSVNTFIGFNAGNYNRNGSNNTFVGTGAGAYSFAANESSFFGDGAGLENVSGYGNSYFGYDAGRTNQTGQANAIFGWYAGAGVTGNSYYNNSLFGSHAGTALTTGSNNALFGYQTGDAITSGSNNILIGYDIDAQSATGDNQLSIGNLIFATGGFGTGTTVGTGNVGIGYATPGQLLDVAGNISTNNLLLAGLDRGAYYGRTRVTENQLAIDESSFWTSSTQRDSGRNWGSVAISSDGKYQTATVEGGYLYTSSNFGTTWTQRGSNLSWHYVAMSSDGKYQTATAYGDYVYTSSDYGVTWTSRDSVRNWHYVAMSSDGRYQTATVDGGYAYTSTDYGVTWTQRDSSRNWRGVALSSDGKYQTAAVEGGYLYVSTDYGVTWATRDSSRNWRDVAMSSDGKYQTAVIHTSGGNIYTSSDYGATWTSRDSSRWWISAAMSSDGKYQTAVVYGGYIYTSIDYGVTWTQRDSSRNWDDVAMSSDGKYQTAVVFSTGYIYTSVTGSYVPGGNIGIGTSTPAYALDVLASGTGTIARFNSSNSTGCTLATGGTITCTSDERLKKNIVSIESSLDALMSLHPVKYNWRYQNDDEAKSLGFIAQQVESVFPQLVITDGNGYKELNTIGLVPILTRAVQEQQEEIFSISLRTTENITTLGELQTSVDSQLSVVGTELEALVATDAAADEKFLADETRLSSIEAFTGQLSLDVNAQSARMATLETQMQTFSAEMQTLMDFYIAFDLGTLVSKDALGNVDLMDGKMRASVVETGALVIENKSKAAPTIGTAIICPKDIEDKNSDGKDDCSKLPVDDPEVTGRDGKNVRVMTDAMIPMVNGSRIFTTFKGRNPGAFSWTEKNPEYDGFRIMLSAPVTESVEVDWIVIEEKDAVSGLVAPVAPPTVPPVVPDDTVPPADILPAADTPPATP